MAEVKEPQELRGAKPEEIVGALDGDLISVFFTKQEGAMLLGLISAGWSQGTLGSRKGYELLAAIEDKMKNAGAELRPMQG